MDFQTELMLTCGNKPAVANRKSILQNILDFLLPEAIVPELFKLSQTKIILVNQNGSTEYNTAVDGLITLLI